MTACLVTLVETFGFSQGVAPPCHPADERVQMGCGDSSYYKLAIRAVVLKALLNKSSEIQYHGHLLGRQFI